MFFVWLIAMLERGLVSSLTGRIQTFRLLGGYSAALSAASDLLIYSGRY